MLPFLKRNEASVSQPVETVERDHDEGFDMIEAIAEDMLEAFKKGDKKRLKDALEAFVVHMQELDEEQDAKILEKK